MLFGRERADAAMDRWKVRFDAKRGYFIRHNLMWQFTALMGQAEYSVWRSSVPRYLLRWRYRPKPHRYPALTDRAHCGSSLLPYSSASIQTGAEEPCALRTRTQAKRLSCHKHGPASSKPPACQNCPNRQSVLKAGDLRHGHHLLCPHSEGCCDSST
jgi:hypothetical protein